MIVIFFSVIFIDLESRILAMKQFLVDFEHENSIDSKYVILLGKHGISKLIAS